ncbi:ATP-dependent helicase HrpB [Spirochaetia bacterium]|nr:ATP-dependent helicase HrpB [Spirochaetia bacterium]
MRYYMFDPANTGLPLVPRLPEICAALYEKGRAIIRSDPGSGKSTLVPLALLDYFESRGDTGKIIMLEPRRAAAMGIAARLAELLGEETGGRVGYAVRLERRVSAKTRIEVVTEGLLVRRMQENPELSGVSTLIFDEFHERSVHTDLAFALALDLCRMGAKLRILVMSATMDAAAVALCIDAIENRTVPDGDAKTPVIECPGRVFPVDTLYRALPQKAPLARECAAAVADILDDELDTYDSLGDILVFLPGKREIALCAEYLAERGFDRDFEILPLHGSLTLREQRRAIGYQNPGADRRRLILSTNVAETSLTIPGVTLVVDSGYARVQRFHLPSGMNRLSLEAVSRNSADQRRGRAGRLGPGRCIRLWAEYETRPVETDPEIKRIDLSSLVLDCLLWGVRRREDLPWLEAPPETAWDRALELLGELGAVSPGADVPAAPTALGREIARLGLEPRLGRLCIAGRDSALAALACASAAILSERDSSGIDDPDFACRLSALRNNSDGAFGGRINQIAGDLLRRLGLSSSLHWKPEDEASIGELVVQAFPDRIAKKQRDTDGPEGIFRFTSGREGRITGPLAGSGWICALEVDAGERMGFIRLAAPVSESKALEVLAGQTVTDKTIEWKGLVPRCLALVRAGRLELSREQRTCRRDELLPELPALFRREGLGLLPWEENRGAAQRLLERIRFFAAHSGEGRADDAAPGKADWAGEALMQDAAEWLGPFIWQGAQTGKGPIIDSPGLVNALENRLSCRTGGWQAKLELDRLVPDQFFLPSGRKKLIDYSSGEPVLRIRLQDAFGIPGECKILSVSIVFELLSPADRPIQITRDLAGFWAGSYADVRKEMRGRYPRHQWPENPGL